MTRRGVERRRKDRRRDDRGRRESPRGLFVTAGVIVTLILTVIVISQARSAVERELGKERKQHRDENGALLAKIEDFRQQNDKLSTQVSDLTAEVDALRTQLIAAGITPVATAPPRSSPTPSSTTTTTRPSSSSGSGSRSPSTTSTTSTTTTTACFAAVGGRCVVGSVPP